MERSQKRLAAKKNKEVQKLVRARVNADKKHEREMERLRKKYERASASEPRRKKSKRGGKKHHRRVHHRGVRMPNPLSGMLEFFTGVLGVVLGAVSAGGVDRWRADHALVANTTGSVTTYTDTPAAGQVYDTAGPQTPIWSNWTRLAGAVVAVAAPLSIAALVPARHRGTKTFLQLWGLGALGRTGAKAGEDVLAKTLKNKSIGLRLYTPEVAAQAELASAKVAQLGSGQDPTKFAGLPEGQIQRIGMNEGGGTPPARGGSTPGGTTPMPPTVHRQPPPSGGGVPGGPGPMPGAPGGGPNGQTGPTPTVECTFEDDVIDDMIPNDGPQVEMPAA